MSTGPSSASQVIQACQDNFPAHSGDCSGFVRAVAAALSVPLQGLANQIVATIRSGNGWTALPNGSAAAQAAGDGKFVVGGLMGSEQAQPNAHGHVVVAVTGPLARGAYPTAYWGMLGGVGAENQTVNYAWAYPDRDNVSYAAWNTNATYVGSGTMVSGSFTQTTAPGGGNYASYNGVSTVMGSGRTVQPSQPAVVEAAPSPTTGNVDPDTNAGANNGLLNKARMGEVMTHGAVIISGSPQQSVDNLALVRLGDPVMCPIHGNTQIISGCSTSLTDQNQFVARLGAKAGCGATVIFGSPNTFNLT